MSKSFISEITSVLEMLENLENDYNLISYNHTEKQVYYSIAVNLNNNNSCNITDIINSSKLSRSSVYKAIKKFENHGLVVLSQSDKDKREFNLALINI